MGSNRQSGRMVALFLTMVLVAATVTHTDSVDTDLQAQWIVVEASEGGSDELAWTHQQRERRDLQVVNGQNQSFTCNANTARVCQCLYRECNTSTILDASETPSTLMTTSGDVISTPGPGQNCCIQVLSNSDLLQIVTLRLQAPMAIYTAEFEGTLRRTLIKVIKDYCYLVTNPCGLTIAETRQLDKVFTPESLFFIYLNEAELPEDVNELQVSFLVYVNALSPGQISNVGNSTLLPESSRVLSYDVLQAIIQQTGSDIGEQLDVVVLTPAYRWLDVIRTLPPPTPTDYPYGLSRWQFVWMCVGATLGISLAFICFISAIKAVV